MASFIAYPVSPGDIVPRSFTTGYIVLSYVVSYIGSVTTLELLHRRTSARGIYNAFLLIGASITMGAISIWCMHFIGNRAIVMANGNPQLQIAYSSTFTALSFFVPILVLLAAFLAIGTNDRVGKLRVLFGGTLAGLSICGMHYLGQAGIANYTSVYDVANVVGSALIAVIASVIALTIFFVMRAAWTNSWWKRALCAILLAGAVSGMHWIASVGTNYRYKQLNQNARLSRNQTVIVVIVLSVGACAMLFLLAIVANRRRQVSASQTKQVVLACVTFDSEGRLLVTPEGVLPSEKITNTYIERSFDDMFSIAHPVFLWVFRTTRNWGGIQDLISGMRNHLNGMAPLNKSPPSSRAFSESSTIDGLEASEDYSVIFRELFCVAAAELADQIDEPITNLGVLYDEIMSTGTLNQSKRRFGFNMITEKQSPYDVESGLPVPVTFGRGQVLFVVRRASKQEATRLSGHGFRFASVSNVIDILARSMQVERSDLASRMESMQEYSKGDQIMEPGVHLGCFAIRARVNGGGFDVLVRRDAKNRLPTVQLPIAVLEEWHLEFLKQCDGWSAGAYLDWLSGKTFFNSPKEQNFVMQLRQSLQALTKEVGEGLFREAMLVAKPAQVPCRGFGEAAMPGRATLIAFRIIVPIHSRATAAGLEFSPLSVFRCQQHVYRNAPDHDVFARKIHREFSSLIEPRPMPKPQLHPSGRRSSQVIPHLTPSRNSPEPKQWWGPLAALERRPVGNVPTVKRDKDEDRKSAINPLGGIMVSQEVSVDVREVNDEEAKVEMEGMGMGTSGCATTEMEDPETFVDQLFGICVEGR